MRNSTALNAADVPAGGIKVFAKSAWEAMSSEAQGNVFKTHNVLLVKEDHDPPLVRIKSWDEDDLDSKFDLDTFYQVQSEYNTQRIHSVY